MISKMQRNQSFTNGRKRRAPTNNNTIKSKVNSAANAIPAKIAKFLQLSVPKCPTKEGSVWISGLGDCGQLGLGADPAKGECRTAQIVASIKNAVDVCAGGMHTLVLTSEGHIYSFGCNDEGALGRDTSEEDSEYEPGLIELPHKVVKITAGDSHSACILENGTVMAWGSFRNSHGNMGLTLEGNKRVPCVLLENEVFCSIASGVDHLVMLTCKGYVYTIGSGEQGQLGRISQRSASGEGRRGKTDLLQPYKVVSRRFNLVDAIWASNSCTFLRQFRTGRIFGFGLNNYRQLAHNKTVETVSNPVLTNCTDVKSIAGGEHHTLVLQTDGTVHVVGNHNYGRLGLGELSDVVTTLTPIEGLRGKFVTDISCGDATSFALTEDGELYVWGLGSNYQLGTGNTKDVFAPERMVKSKMDDKRILRASSGGQHSVFLVESKSQDDNTSSEVAAPSTETKRSKLNGK